MTYNFPKQNSLNPVWHLLFRKAFRTLKCSIEGRFLALVIITSFTRKQNFSIKRTVPHPCNLDTVEKDVNGLCN